MTRTTDPSPPDPSPPDTWAGQPAVRAGQPFTARPEELPPVTPPSAGYIVQLFLIPALIVAAVVAVWALFGKLADSETDWKQLVAELGSSNEHRRWRSALGLAQLLRNDELAPREDQIPLAEQPIVVDGLVGLLKSSLDSKSSSAEDIKHQEFLARTMGSLRADDRVLPVLAQAIRDQQDAEVRRSALMSVAAIAGRHFEQATGYQQSVSSDAAANIDLNATLPLNSPTINNPEIWEQLKLAAQDPDPVIRHLAAFAAASISGPEAMELLRVMLLDGDTNTRANAAIGLARNGSTSGLQALQDLLLASNLPFDPGSAELSPGEDVKNAKARFEVEQSGIARNCLRAIGSLWPQISQEQQLPLTPLIQQTAERHFAADVRSQARELIILISER